MKEPLGNVPTDSVVAGKAWHSRDEDHVGNVLAVRRRIEIWAKIVALGSSIGVPANCYETRIPPVSTRQVGVILLEPEHYTS